MRHVPLRLALTIVLTLTSVVAVAAGLNASVTSIPVGSTLQLTRELAVDRGADSVLLGENKLQAGFNKGFQWNNQRLGQWPAGLNRGYGDNSYLNLINGVGESAQQSYEDCKDRYRHYYWRDKGFETETRIESTEGLFRDGTITTRGTWNDNAWVYSEQGPHPCVAPSYTYAVLLINKRESGGTFRRGHEFVVEDVDAYERRGEYIVDIELDSRVARALRVVSSEPLSGIQIHQLVGSSLRGIAGGYFDLALPKTRYYE